MTEKLFSYSRVQAYRDCHYKHFLRYVKKIEKKQKPRALYFGTDFHKLLEARWNEDLLPDAWQEIINGYQSAGSAALAEYGDNYLEDLEQIFNDYFQVYKDEPSPLSIETEVELQLPLFKFGDETILYIGFVDEIMATESGIIIGEHKTFSHRPDKVMLTMNTQKCIYAKALEKVRGQKPTAVRWDYIKSTPASEPKWLEKSGRFSTVETQTITPFSYRRAAEKRGVEVDEEILQAFEKNIPNFFFRETQELIPKMVDKVFYDFKQTVKEIVKNGENNKTKNITRNCSYCDFFNICYTQLTDGNVKELIERDYQEKEDFDGKIIASETD